MQAARLVDAPPAPARRVDAEPSPLARLDALVERVLRANQAREYMPHDAGAGLGRHTCVARQFCQLDAPTHCGALAHGGESMGGLARGRCTHRLVPLFLGPTVERVAQHAGHLRGLAAQLAGRRVGRRHAIKSIRN